MTGSGAHIYVNLARLAAGESMTHLSRFLPELVASRPDDTFTTVVPHKFAAAVKRWGLTVWVSSSPGRALPAPLPWDRAAARRTGRRPDLVLGPLSHVPVMTRIPQIVWVRQVPEDVGAGDRPDRAGATLARVLLSRSSLVVHPTATARHIAELAGLKGPGIILRAPLREAAGAVQRPQQHSAGRVRVLVPANDERRRNLELIPRLSAVLGARGVDHHIVVAGDFPPSLGAKHVSGGPDYDRDRLAMLRDRVDVVLVTSISESCSSPVVEFERLGFPVAASRTDTHVELCNRARLFDPASPHGAADALLAAVEAGHSDDGSEHGADWRFTTPAAYAAAVSAEIDRLIEGREIPWAV